MNLRIAIIETEHFEVLDPVLHLLLQVGAEVHVMCSKQVYLSSELKSDSRLHWHYSETDCSPRVVLQNFKKILGTLCLNTVLLLTVSNNHYLYSRLKKKDITVILGIHDLNSYLIPQFKMSFRGFVRYVSKKILYNRANAYLVFSEKQTSMLKAETQKKVHYIPPALFHSVQFSPRSYTHGQELLVVVPGSIDIKRRNYEDVFSLYQEMKKYPLNIRLVLLGSPPANQLDALKDRLNALSTNENTTIEFFEEHVPTDLFFEYLRKAHFIWAPVQKVFDNEGESWETYGVTKISGSVYDAIRVGRPLLLPDYYVSDPALLKNALFYRSISDIVKILVFVAEHPEQYAVYQLQALTASMEFVPEKWTDAIEKIN